MSPFEFICAFYSVVLGVAMAQRSWRPSPGIAVIVPPLLSFL